MAEYESFEVQGTAYDQNEDKVALVKQIATDFISKNPSYNFVVKIEGNNMLLTYHSYEADLHSRYRDICQESEKLLDGFVKNLKKEYKEKSDHNLKMKEDKEFSRNDQNIKAEKVSMNNRYYFRNTRKYEI